MRRKITTINEMKKAWVGEEVVRQIDYQITNSPLSSGKVWTYVKIGCAGMLATIAAKDWGIISGREFQLLMPSLGAVTLFNIFKGLTYDILRHAALHDYKDRISNVAKANGQCVEGREVSPNLETFTVDSIKTREIPGASVPLVWETYMQRGRK